MVEALQRARQAVVARVWDDAVRAFEAADGLDPLAPGDLEALADARWWSGNPESAVEALERAHAAHERAGDPTAAAAVALRLAESAFQRGAVSVLRGWVARAATLLDGQPESAVHAQLQFMRAPVAYFLDHDADSALGRLDDAIAIAVRHRDRDTETIARSVKGQLLIRAGQWDEGLALIDEAAAVASAGELGPRVACDVYCSTISACRDVADYRRAGEWTDQAQRWMGREGVRGYVGVCKVHRAELQRLRGALPEAEDEARRACEELERFHMFPDLGFAHNEVGEVRLRLGDLDAAEEAFTRAHEYGFNPQPGLALVRLARGDVRAASRAIARSLAADDLGPEGSAAVVRGRLLPAQVEIALAAGDVDTAHSAADELALIAADHVSVVWDAAARTARGAVLLYEGDAPGAIALLEPAWRGWQQADVPYEAARARVLLGRAYALEGDDGAARLEWRAARSMLERLGAVLELERVARLLGETPSGTERRRVTRTFLFTDIVNSTELVQMLGDRDWEDLLAWHDQTLRTALEAHDGREVSHTGDGFFVAFDQPARAIEASVAIQRSLAEHRRAHGFAPGVRIGLHTAEATEVAGDYRGSGVHVAARIGAIAGRDEILASAATVDAGGGVSRPMSEPRAVALRGFAEPVQVQVIDWR
jgi:class 3 adenylate cyclase